MATILLAILFGILLTEFNLIEMDNFVKLKLATFSFVIRIRTQIGKR